MEHFDIFEIQQMGRQHISDVKMGAGLPATILKFEEAQQIEDSTIYKFTDGPYVGLPWVSCSDFLIGKVALKPPFTQKHKQAQTHEGILELGGDVESMFLNEMKLDRAKAINERENYLTRMFAAKKADLIQNFRKEEEMRAGAHIDAVRLFYENKISEFLWNSYQQVKVLEEQMQVEYDSLNIIWKACLEREIEDTVIKITEEFLEKLHAQERMIVNMFTTQIKALKMKKKFAIELEKVRCREMIIQMKHKLHCENISNLMFLLCKERRRCKAEKMKIEDDYLARIGRLGSTVARNCDTIENLTEIKNKKTQELRVKERCLIQVLRQFQKLMYLALQSTPTRGSFLMSIYKLIKCELEDYSFHTETPKQVRKKISKRTKLHQVRHDPDIEEFLKYSNYPVDDDTESTWPVFFFNKKKFIREDFNISPKKKDTEREVSLWNPEVEELLNIFEKSINEKRDKIEKMKSEHSSVRFSATGEPLSPESPRSGSTVSATQTFGKSVKKGPLSEHDEEKEIRKMSLDDKDASFPKLSSPSKKSSKTGSLLKSQDDFEPRRDMRSGSLTQSRLSLARDSLTLMKSSIDEYSEHQRSSGSVPSELADELEHTSSLEVEKPTKSTSKLLFACDSIEIFKPINVPEHEKVTKHETTNKRKSLLIFSPNVSVIQKYLPQTEQIKETPPPMSKQVPLKKLFTPPKRTTPVKPRVIVKAKVVGSRQMKENKQTVNEFTSECMADLLHMMKNNPSVIPLFTPCTK